MSASGSAMAHALWRLGTPEQKRFAQIAIDRKWTSTMALTEPDAGSDVGAGRARAIQQPDGTWHIEGVKRFITSGEHDMAENIFHLVLARAPRVCRCSWCPSSWWVPTVSLASATVCTPPTSSTRWA